MKNILIAFLLIFLGGCATTKPGDGFVQKEIVVETQYVVRKASLAQKKIPDYPAPINVAAATQLDLADWIARSEERMLNLESIIKRLIEFYEKPITDEEKKDAASKKTVSTTTTPIPSGK